MIINNAGSRCDVDFWTKHLTSKEENDRAELCEIRGLDADNLHDALLEMKEQARILPRLENFMYHADFNPPINREFTAEEWQRSFELFEKQRGIPEGTPRVVYEHEKKGRTHRHVIWLRVDFEKMRAFPDGHNDIVAQVAANEIVKEFGLDKVVRAIDFEPGTPRPPRAPEPWEMYRGMKTGLDPRDITAEVTELYRQSDSGPAFQTALELHGYELVTGKRGLLILDSAGKEHSLVKRIDGVNKKELDAFMHDVDREQLPTVEQAKERFEDRKLEGLEADRATVRDEIEWAEAMEQAAIAREEKERRFVEQQPEPQPENEHRAGGREDEDVENYLRAEAIAQREELEEFDHFLAGELFARWKSDPAHFERTFAPIKVDSVREKFGKLVRDDIQREEAEQREDWQQYIADLDKFLAGELFQRWLQDPRRFAEQFEPRMVPNVDLEFEKLKLEQWEKEKQELAATATPPAPPAPLLSKTAGEIRLAYTLTGTGQEFANALEDRGHILACVTERDAERLNKWERQRLKEIKELEAAAQPPQNDTAQEKEQAATAKPHHRTDTWMAKTGGADALGPELREKAEAAYAKWQHWERFSFADYVSYVQQREAENPHQQGQQEKNLDKYHRYKAGELVVVDQRGGVYQLNRHNTGHDKKTRENRLRDINGAALLSVSAADSAMQQMRQYRRDEAAHVPEEAPPIFSGQAFAKVITREHYLAQQEKEQREKATAFAVENNDPAPAAKGISARIGHMARYSDSTRALLAALDDNGIALARVTKDEAEQSYRLSEFARAVGNTAPSYREGEIVAVTLRGTIHRLNERTTGQPAERLEKHFSILEYQPLKGIEATKADMLDRAEQLGEELAEERMERATNIKDYSYDFQEKARLPIKEIQAGVTFASKIAAKALDVIAGVVEGLMSFFLFDGPKSKEQIEISHADRDRRAYFVPVEQEAAQQRQRERERERDR